MVRTVLGCLLCCIWLRSLCPEVLILDLLRTSLSDSLPLRLVGVGDLYRPDIGDEPAIVDSKIC